MRLDPEIEITTTARIVVEGNVFIVETTKEATRRHKNKMAIVIYGGGVYLGKITTIDMRDPNLPYCVVCADNECEAEKEGTHWYACSHVFPLEDSEYEKIRALIPEKFV